MDREQSNAPLRRKPSKQIRKRKQVGIIPSIRQKKKTLPTSIPFQQQPNRQKPKKNQVGITATLTVTSHTHNLLKKI